MSWPTCVLTTTSSSAPGSDRSKMLPSTGQRAKIAVTPASAVSARTPTPAAAGHDGTRRTMLEVTEPVKVLAAVVTVMALIGATGSSTGVGSLEPKQPAAQQAIKVTIAVRTFILRIEL